MSMNPLQPDSQGSSALEENQAQAWRSVRENKNQIEKAARRLQTIDVEPEPDAPSPQLLSPLERLPEELLILIMQCLDHESLYRLSQTTAHFLRLSFDNVFEMDAAWRAFRHTVDLLNDGPHKRLQNGLQRPDNTTKRS
ncbi:hypothetical protein F4861DRAFT_356601 [Xylaria intraflava]|nr:hypothetical protein F4861DRAFT_356601 [Xylaria intraflava]